MTQVCEALLSLLFIFYPQDVKFCSPNDSTCYRELSQDTSDCDVSCTGLYADVVFTEDKILNLKTELTTVVNSWEERRLQVELANKGKERQRLLKLLKKYTDYKNSFVRQIKFDPSLANTSEYVYVQRKRKKT